MLRGIIVEVQYYIYLIIHQKNRKVNIILQNIRQQILAVFGAVENKPGKV